MAILSVLITSGFVYAEGNIYTANVNGSNISSTSIFVVPGQSNSTLFRIYASGGNLTNVAFYYLGRFNISINPANTSNIIDGDYRTINLTINAAGNLTAGIFNEKIVMLTSKPQNLEFSFILTIPETQGWNISESFINKSVIINEVGKLSNLSIINYGNIKISGHVSVLGDTDLIWMDNSDFSIEPLQTLIRPIYYQITRNLTPGEHEINVTFIDSLSNTRKLRILFTITDELPPTINNVYQAADAGKIFSLVEVQAFVNDNVKVINVTGKFESETERRTFTRINDNLWTINLNLTLEGYKRFSVSAIDASNNGANADVYFNVTKYDFVDYTENAKFYRFKLESYGEAKLMNIKQQTRINFTLRDIQLSNLNTNNTVNISIKSGVNELIMEIGKTYSIDSIGDVIILAEAINYTSFEGYIDVAGNEYIDLPSSIKFTGEAYYYTVTPDSTIALPNFGNLDCKANDNDVYDLSSYDCVYKNKIDIGLENIAVVSTLQALQSERQSYNREVNFISEQRANAQFWLILIGVILLIIMTIIFFKKFILDKRISSLNPPR